MTKEDLVAFMIAHTDTLYYVSYSLLHNKADQEDAIQQSIERALRKIGALRDDSLVKPWFTRILINECYNIMRRRKREFPSEMEHLSPPPSADEDLHHAMMSLDEKLRLPIVLHYQQSYTTKEVAAILRIPEGTVKGRLVKGRKELGRLLRDEGVFA